MLKVGQIVMNQGYEFVVIELQGSRFAPDGQRTWYYRGRATDSPRNKGIAGTGYAEGNYSYRPAATGAGHCRKLFASCDCASLARHRDVSQ